MTDSHTAYEPHPTAAMDRQYRRTGMNLLKHDNVHTNLQGKRRIRYLEDEYAKLWQMYGDIEDERNLLREGHRLIKGFAEHIRDNAGNANLVTTRAGNIIRWIEINALQEDRDD